MDNKPVTIDTILEYLEKAVESKTPLPPSVWLDGAQKMNILLGDESDRLYGLQQKVAQMKLSYLLNDKKKNVSAAKLYVETTEEYKQMRLQEAKIKRVEEAIRISKVQARLRSEEMRGY